MPVCQASNVNKLRHTPLIAGLALILSLNLSVARSTGVTSATIDLNEPVPASAPAQTGGAKEVAWQWSRTHRAPIRPAATVTVTNCNNSGPGSLRQAFIDAVSADTIDLTTLTCSRITLSTGVISTHANDLIVRGPGARALTIDGNASASHPHSVFYHFGSGTLAFTGVTITGGFYTGGSSPMGGCIYSKAGVYLSHSVVTGCTLAPATGPQTPKGGGIYARGGLTAKYSVISDNEVLSVAVNGAALGGGVFAGGDLVTKYSTISDNRSTASWRGNAAGLHAEGSVSIVGTTISGNVASHNNCALEAAGLASASVTISSSTISGNVAGNVNAGVFTNSPLTLRNSTIAFNRAGTSDCMPMYGYASCDAGVHIRNVSANVQSTIIARNRSDSGPADISLVGSGTVTGANNLVIAPHVAMPGTILADPLLYPLANNGGPTRTHALRPGSPAIDKGNNASSLDYDQRGIGYARLVRANADIGAFERQSADDPDYLLIDGFDGD